MGLAHVPTKMARRPKLKRACRSDKEIKPALPHPPPLHHSPRE